MKTNRTLASIVFFGAASFACLSFSARAFADEETAASVKIDEPLANTSSSVDQLLTISLGSFQPESVLVANGSYVFDYGTHPASFQAQAGWAFKLFEMYGGFYLEGTVALSTFKGNAIQGAGSTLAASSYSLGLLGLDSRLMYSGDWFPWKRLVPFVDGGFRYSVYYQPGDSGLESVEGGVGNPVMGAGLRLWLNRDSSLAGNMPWFLSARVDRIFPVADSMNLASLSVYGGISLGL